MTDTRTLADRISEMPYPGVRISSPMVVKYTFPYDEFACRAARQVHGCVYDRRTRSYSFRAQSPEQVQAIIDGLRAVHEQVQIAASMRSAT